MSSDCSIPLEPTAGVMTRCLRPIGGVRDFAPSQLHRELSGKSGRGRGASLREQAAGSGTGGRAAAPGAPTTAEAVLGAGATGSFAPSAQGLWAAGREWLGDSPGLQMNLQRKDSGLRGQGASGKAWAALARTDRRRRARARKGHSPAGASAAGNRCAAGTVPDGLSVASAGEAELWFGGQNQTGGQGRGARPHDTHAGCAARQRPPGHWAEPGLRAKAP